MVPSVVRTSMKRLRNQYIRSVSSSIGAIQPPFNGTGTGSTIGFKLYETNSNMKALRSRDLEHYALSQLHRKMYSSSSLSSDETKPEADSNCSTITKTNSSTEGTELVQTQNEEKTIEIVINVPDHISIPGPEKGGKKLAIVYTCTICNTRCMKQFTERAYNHGVVIVTCPKCQKQHLIADRLGYFSEAHDENNTFDLTTIAKRYGHSYKRITAQQEESVAGSTNHNDNDEDAAIPSSSSSSSSTTTGLTTKLTLEDLLGPDKMKEILQNANIKNNDASTDTNNKNEK
jgi:hypothetical protein